MLEIGRENRRRTFAKRLLFTAALAVANVAHAAPLTLFWDPSGTNPANPTDGSGTWNLTSPLWSNGTTDQDWVGGNNTVGYNEAVIGNQSSTGDFTVTLAQNIHCSDLYILGAAGGSYTINGGGHTLTAGTSIVVDGSDNSSVVLTNGTFLPSNTNPDSYGAVSINGGTLTLGPAATLQGLAYGSFYDKFGNLIDPNGTLYLNGGTVKPGNYDYTGGYGFDDLDHFSNIYFQSGGLTFDTSLFSAITNSSNGLTATAVAFLTHPLLHDPALATADGGLTKVGTGTLIIGVNTPTDPVETYNGPTIVNGGTLYLRDLAGTIAAGATVTTGPFPNTSFTVNAGAQLEVRVNDGIAGETGTTPVTLNGGQLYIYSNASNGVVVQLKLANLTMSGASSIVGGALTGTTAEFLPAAELHATSGTGSSIPTVSPTFVIFDPGSDVRVDAGATMTIASKVVNGTSPTSLLLKGAGTLQMTGSSTYTGSTNISGGVFSLTSTGLLSGTPSIVVASGAKFVDAGRLSSTPAITNSGTIVFGPAIGTGIIPVALGAMNIAAGATTSVLVSAAHANRQVLTVNGLTIAGTTNAWTGKLDLGDNDLIVHGGSLATLTNQLKSGYSASSWTGQGITSSAASGNSTHLTALGVLLNNDGSGHALYGSGTTAGLFDGLSPAVGDVLVKYTYYGDASLDGHVDGSDYTRIDNGFNNSLTGWSNGDFNYDGVINGSDYTLIDNAFNTQGASLGVSQDAFAAGVVADATVGSFPVSGSVTVPEPASIVLVGLAGVSLIARRRRA